MRYIINALPLRVGGGLTVGLETVKHLDAVGGGDRFVVLATPGLGYEDLESNGIRVHPVPWHLMDNVQRLVYLNREIPRLIRGEKADGLFTMGNMPTVYPGVPQAVLFHLAHLVYPEVAKRVLKRTSERILLDFRRRYFRRAIQGAVVICQTNTMRKRLMHQFKLEEGRIRVVPNARWTIRDTSVDDGGSRDKLDQKRRVLVLTRYYAHKNLEILPRVARMLQEMGRSDIVITTTISGEQGAGAAQWLRMVNEDGLLGADGPIWNIGEVPREKVHRYLASSWACLLPTLMESFSGTYIEAMAAGCPIVTSDRDFAREICGDAAVYVDPLDPGSIADAMVRVVDDNELRMTLIQAGRERITQQLPTGEENAATYVRILHEMVR